MSTRRGNDGFVLVGVVMFVLALTIIGMSLYAVSSYEVQFLGQSHDETAALYKAQGGLDMVCEQLSIAPHLMSSADTLVGIEGVTYAVAMQRRSDGSYDSTGAINFGSDSTITVMVRAKVGDEVRQLKARFVPHVRSDFYKRLFTVAGETVSLSLGQALDSSVVGSIYVETSNPAFDDGLANRRLRTLSLGDTCHVWQASTDATWCSSLPARVDWEMDRPLTVGGVSPPDVQAFYAAHPPASAYEPGIASSEKLQFNKHPAYSIGYYRTPDDNDVDYSYHPGGEMTLEISGTVVWELPRGFRSEDRIKLKRIGTEPATLVMVGSPWDRIGQYSDDLLGLWFFGGLDVDHDNGDVNVILVSEGQVTIERSSNRTRDESVRRLSVYCKGLFLMGPLLGYRTSFNHRAEMDAVIDYLEANDALPHPSITEPEGFTLVRGSWQDITP